MRSIEGAIELSASDLVGHLNCRYLTSADLAVARGQRRAPAYWDPGLQVLRERGAAHERQYVEHLKATGHRIVHIGGVGIADDPLGQTVAAMCSGADVIVQAALSHAGWVGRADVLRRVSGAAGPSRFGSWHYEVIDTKLARETKGGTVLQLCLYSDLLARLQGVEPEFMYVVAPWRGFEPEQFRIREYSAYYRLVRASLETTVGAPVVDGLYPDPKPHCEICRWRRPCDTRRRADDHISLVAGISALQMDELRGHGVCTGAGLATVSLPLPWKPHRGAASSYVRVREQARVQMEGRAQGRPVHELLDLEPGYGLARLPQPSPGDIFFDLEGDPFVGDGGLEYLFGYLLADSTGQTEHVCEWVLSRDQERRTFERFIDFVMARWRQHPEFHVYHFAAYEPAALKRLMGRYATREEELDRMLRASLFVDLYSVTRRALRASVESYSIKHLEALYGFTRSIDLPAANRALAAVQACLELSDPKSITEEHRSIVQGYNRDDCASTHALRDWLELLRARQIQAGLTIERPQPGLGDASPRVDAWQQLVERVLARLTAEVPAEPKDRSPDQQAQWLLAGLLDWHRREEKAVWWEYFRLRDMTADELIDERSAISGLTFIEELDGSKAPVHRYRFPAQDTDLRGGEALRSLGGEKFGHVCSVSSAERFVDIKKRQDCADVHPVAVFAHDVVSTEVLARSLLRLGEQVAETGMVADGAYVAARDLLLRQPPRVGGEPVRRAGETALEAALRLAPKLRGGVLPVQGPPGSGKTFTGARLICKLVSDGARIGIAATSHKVIRHLLEKVVAAAGEAGVTVSCIEKVSDPDKTCPEIVLTDSNAELFAALGSSCQVAAGTAWLWARPEARGAVDVLFVDEAAQMSLANVLAMSQAADSLVLLGDPQQLDQPTQGSHPDGAGVSALDHVLGGRKTIETERGLFLDETWRLHPTICSFTSEVFYEGRLRSRPGLEEQRISSGGPLAGSGLRYLPVSHRGNQSSSPEEADRVQQLVRTLLERPSWWRDRNGEERPIGLDDILIIAPYNAQVFELQRRMPQARIGTVDKFQGQEAPVVIYTMATSTTADAPHGMEFLYSLNRFNVATSRARCLCTLVGTEALFEPECRTPRQMQLANAFCRYREMAEVIGL
jgi:uncharacterized protein